jgi:RNA polymerase sigma-70 factor (ECF subfamily)
MDEIQRGVPVDEATLVDLIKRAQRTSDPEAFDRLYLLYVNRIFRYLLARLGDVEAAEELTAQVFVRLIEKIDLYRIGPKDNGAIFSAWLYRIAHNKMVDVQRARKRLPQIALEQVMQVPASVFTYEVEERLDLEEILQKLDDLPDQQREVIMLRFVEGHSIGATAHILQKSENAVKALQHRALESLRHYFKH